MRCGLSSQGLPLAPHRCHAPPRLKTRVARGGAGRGYFRGRINALLPPRSWRPWRCWRSWRCPGLAQGAARTVGSQNGDAALGPRRRASRVLVHSAPRRDAPRHSVTRSAAALGRGGAPFLPSYRLAFAPFGLWAHCASQNKTPSGRAAPRRAAPPGRDPVQGAPRATAFDKECLQWRRSAGWRHAGAAWCSGPTETDAVCVMTRYGPPRPRAQSRLGGRNSSTRRAPSLRSRASAKTLDGEPKPMAKVQIV